MPAAIRIDIHLAGFRDTEESAANSRNRLSGITDRLTHEIRRVLMEETNVPEDEKEGTLTTQEMIRVRTHDGLGPSWPPEEENRTVRIGEGAAQFLENLAAGVDMDTLSATNGYDDGSFHVHVLVDLR